MADFNALEALINANIKKNGVQAITGNILNGILRGMVSALGKGYTIAGSVTPSSDPGTMTGPVAYIAYTAGTYTHFDGLEVEQGEVAMLIYNEAEWHKEVLYSLAATATVDGNVGTPEVGVSFVDGLLTFNFRNMKGEPGVNGQDGEAAGFGAVTASVDASVGTPSVTVSSSGPNTAKSFAFSFHNLKGEQGVQGIQGIQGPQGVQGEQGIQGPVGVESCVVTVDNTSGTPSCSVSLVGQVLHLDFTGLKGLQGDTGSSVDYPFTIVNNLTTNDATQALSAAMGVQLESEVSQLEAEVNGIFSEIGGEQPEGFGISDEEGYVIAKFENGHIQTKEFNSADSPRVASGTTTADFGISDEDGNVIVKFEDGHIKTKNFDSSDIEGGGGYNSIPSYFEDEVTDTESKIEAITSTGVATIVMPIVTDNHIDWTDRDKERVMETLSCIHKINKDNGLDAVANLGDIPTMWGRNGVTDTEIFSRLKWYIDAYKGVHKNVFFANGNHDGESSDFFNKEKWYPLTKYNKGIVVRNGNSPYFYYDFADMKVRFIFMSIPCSTDETRTTQGITTYYPSEKTVHTYWGAGQEQLNWLANDALKTGDGWKVVLLSHTPVCYNYSTHNGIYDLMGRVEDQADIEGIFNAYHNHSTYSSANVSCDFTTYSSTRMLLAIAGHIHADMIIDSGQKPTGSFNTNGLPCKIVVISCQMMNRTDKTVNQDQYDYMVYNGKTDQFNFIRFGNGSDRVITF